ncbi:MAG: glycosyltransferase family 4 protein [Actinomycetota bacterium]
MSRATVTTIAPPQTSGAGRLGGDAVFLVWGPPGRGPRSRAFGQALGMDVVYISASAKRGRLAAFYKYPVQMVQTVRVLRRRRPRVVFVQSPPSLAVMAAWAYAKTSRARYVVDAHSCAMRSFWWTRPRWLYRGLTRSAAATLVTNGHYAASLEADGGRTLVIRDVPLGGASASESEPEPAAGGGFDVMVVNTFAPDEPLEEIVRAAEDLPDVTFHVTGDLRRVGGTPPPAPANVRFTGFLSDEDYRSLMASAGAVMCLTTHDHTMQRGACEALWAGRPIVTSDWELLRDYFDDGTEHVDNSVESIGGAVRAIAADPARYERGIAELQVRRRSEWDGAVASLATAIGAAPATGEGATTEVTR